MYFPTSDRHYLVSKKPHLHLGTYTTYLLNEKEASRPSSLASTTIWRWITRLIIFYYPHFVPKQDISGRDDHIYIINQQARGYAADVACVCVSAPFIYVGGY